MELTPHGTVNFCNSYLTKQYAADNAQSFKSLYHSKSPNNRYFIIEQQNTLYDGVYDEIILKLFKICEGDTGTTINFIKNLCECEENIRGFTWSNTGNMIICEYESSTDSLFWCNTTDVESVHPVYHIVYFDLIDDCRQFDLFADKKYKWEHNMHFSDDDSMLVTVYNSEYIRIFAFDNENKNYVFKYEKMFDKNVANIHLTSDNKLIVTECKWMNYCNVNAYQISDDLTELTELNTIPFHSDHKFKLDLLKCIDQTYLVYNLSDSIFSNPKSIIVYNLITLNIHEVIDFKKFGITFIDFYNEQIICNDISGNANMFNILTHTLTPLTIPNTHSIRNKIYHKNYFINANYQVYQFDNVGTGQHIFNKKFKLYANGHNKTMINDINSISDIYPIHITPNYIIINIDDDIYIANSIQFCSEKNSKLITQMLYEYIPVELCSQIANYI
jgi:hypothetical protein